MKRARFSEEQILSMWGSTKRGRDGRSVPRARDQRGDVFPHWKRRLGGPEVSRPSGSGRRRARTPSQEAFGKSASGQRGAEGSADKKW